jgi:hypothetical protein
MEPQDAAPDQALLSPKQHRILMVIACCSRSDSSITLSRVQADINTSQ